MTGYRAVRDRVETYFDRTATETWERLTSEAPVSRVRVTVRAGRDRMRAVILAQLPEDLSGARVLDAGCGAGQLSAALAARGADVLAVDISPRLLAVAKARMPEGLPGQVIFTADDMLDPSFGPFDYVVGMDSLIYYDAPSVARAVGGLAERCSGPVVFTLPPRTPLLMAMWGAGRLFPRADRAPLMVPQTRDRVAREMGTVGARLREIERVNSGFYISTCLEVAP